MINGMKSIPFLNEYHAPLLNYLDRPVLIKERKQNIDAASYETN